MFTAGNRFISVMMHFIILGFGQTYCFGQCATSREIWTQISVIENDTILTDAEKLYNARNLKTAFDKCALPHDSVYAKLLHRVAALEFIENGYIATSTAVGYALESIRINTSGSASASPAYVVNSYYNLATFYRTLNLNNKALAYYDSAIAMYKKAGNWNEYAVDSRTYKADILFKKGDYQKCIDECTYGMFEARKGKQDNAVMELFNRRAQSYAYLGLVDNAFAEADSAAHYANSLHADFEMATALKIKAHISATRGQYDKAAILFDNAIEKRLKTNEYRQVADDYTDAGNFYLEKRKQYRRAEACYFKTIAFAEKSKDAERLCKGYINLGEVYFQFNPANEYALSEKYYRKALAVYNIQITSILQNPGLKTLSAIGNTDLLLTILNNKTELLLNIYKLNASKAYINACLQTALVMDSAIGQARRGQTGEQSKLYWRNKTRSFFANALDACYRADDMKLAFYFMEKSRAVLLNDKLNEINASVHLPESEAGIELEYLTRIISDEKKLHELDMQSPMHNKQQIKLLQTKADFELYVKKLEKKYPLYYQYKYADAVPSLDSLRHLLQQHGNYFVHYFLQDSVVYMLAIGTDKTRMIKLQPTDFDIADINTFLKFCADKQQLNNHYTDFAAVSYRLYQRFFEPLHLPKAHIILCTDNFLFPFEALSSDKEGKSFLVYDYVFSYVYSAAHLLKKIQTYPSAGSFVGFAPVSFQTYLSVPDLKNAAVSLKNTSTSYGDAVLFTNKEATRNNFMQKMPAYSIVNVFSHAFADTTNMEPVLYMQDSVINLSELQLLNHPATQLVMLSACQTNVGKNATGEGIYSLARGFASAGIPAVSATLWKADEEAIYIISQKFNEYISQGLRKDDALQKAKIFFMKNERKDKLLPYFWANMVLIGNGEPVHLSRQQSLGRWGKSGLVVFILISSLMCLLYYFRKR